MVGGADLGMCEQSSVLIGKFNPSRRLMNNGISITNDKQCPGLPRCGTLNRPNSMPKPNPGIEGRQQPPIPVIVAGDGTVLLICHDRVINSLQVQYQRFKPGDSLLNYELFLLYQ